MSVAAGRTVGGRNRVVQLTPSMEDHRARSSNDLRLLLPFPSKDQATATILIVRFQVFLEGHAKHPPTDGPIRDSVRHHHYSILPELVRVISGL